LNTSAQSDTCYTKEQNRKIAEKLIEGENAKKEAASLQNLYNLSQKEIEMYSNSVKVETLKNVALREELEKETKKKKRRTKWLIASLITNIIQAAT
jgi:adenine-specific DNA methylase